ncbi:Os11g0533000 [Oryza sativa Japonica Group]|uniref:Os11g0533000 protein n=1 Tax=Oryza sativa subsp. japonica TaxID=39947 RepID=A0A0P0Y3A6_ORYSJ|nr:hypothetical protein EE612_055927 [Oryza sativa]BAT14293.1 Os11g0533000 [Oryza sativa Japonica Group]
MLQYGVQSPAATASVEPSLAQGGLRGGLRERRCLLPPSCSSCRPHRFATATQSTPLVTISVAVAMQVSPLKGSTNGHEQAAAGYSLLQGNFAAPNQVTGLKFKYTRLHITEGLEWSMSSIQACKTY